MLISGKNRKIIEEKLIFVYGEKRSKKIIMEIEKLLDKYQKIISFQPKKKNFLNEKDVVLITYTDNFWKPGEKPLVTLNKFLVKYLKEAISLVHLLPFYPYSSDDGFSVIDYKKVNLLFGDWSNIENISKNFDLIFDAVVNHISSKSLWFREYLKVNPRYDSYFIAFDTNVNTSSVLRARAHSLLTKFKRKGKEVYLWTTFSSDQIDLNYHNEKILLEVIDLILFYATKKARIIRLDAIGHIWKKLGTSCINLEEVHKIVQLLRAVLNEIFPNVLLLTETNVPYQENVRYFGNGYDETQLIYQFPLPALVMHTFHSGDVSRLVEWAKSLRIFSKETTYFNLLASHDGIGIRPAIGILSDDEINELINFVKKRDGFVSYATTSDGKREPYELNSTYYDAITDSTDDEELNIKKFIASQSILLSFIGVPGIYVHSLFGTSNYLEGVEKTGQNRTINRKKFEFSDLEKELSCKNTKSYKIFTALKELIKKRRKEKAFNPNGDQRVLCLSKSIFALIRISPDYREKIVVLTNTTNRRQEFFIPKKECGLNNRKLIDIISENSVNIENKITLEPYQIMWLRNQNNKK